MTTQLPEAVVPPQSRGIMPFERAEAVILDTLDGWVPELYHMPMWRLIGGKDLVGRNILYGWAVENYHYTGSVQRHITPVIRGNTRPGEGLSHRLLTHMSEEWDHPKLFLEAAQRIARACGSDEEPARSRPLAATTALVDFLRQAGRVHPVVYKTCAATLERTAVKVEETKVFYHHVASCLQLPTSAVAPFIAHTETDESYEHLNSLSEFRDDITEVETDLVATALTYARDFVDLYRTWQAVICEHYRGFPAGHGSLVS